MKRRLVPVLLLCAGVAYAIAVVTRAQTAALSLLSDDAYYYFVIAQNALAGHGFTFDGIAPTNGFHPLWMGVVLGVFKLAGRGELRPLIAVMLVSGAIATATLISIHRIVEDYLAPGYGLVAVAAALLPNLLSAMLNGLETGLQLFMAVILVGACCRYRLLDPGASTRRVGVLGLLIGLVTLARLDGVFLAPAALFLGLAVWWGRGLKQTMTRVLALGAGVAIVVGPYLLWNVVSFGRIMPSSGVAKSSFPHLARHLAFSDDKPWGALMLAALWAMIAFTYGVERHRGTRPSLRTSPIVMIAIACTLHFVNVSLFMAWGVYWWHFTLYGLGIAFALPGALSALVGPHVRVARAMQTIAVASLVLLAAWSKSNELPSRAEQHAGWLDAARWARDTTDDGTVFALADAGLFAYFSHRPVVNLDGKANSYEYLRHVEARTVPRYLASIGTRYVASTHARYNQKGTYQITILRPDGSAAPLEMDRSWEVYRGAEIPAGLARFSGEVTMSNFAIWKLPDGYGR